MEKIKFDSNFLRKNKEEKSRIFSAEQELADTVWNYFYKKIPFSLIMKFINTKGYQFIYEVYQDVKQSKADNKLALFIHLVGKTKIEWKD